MIRYALKCAEAHEFESWFASAEAFDKLSAAGRLSCPACGSRSVRKALMTPGVSGAAEAPDGPPRPSLRATSPAELVLARLREEIEKRSDYVGDRFATEARRIHLGEAPERAIHGEAKPDEARALIEDGIEVTPLPFPVRQKSS